METFHDRIATIHDVDGVMEIVKNPYFGHDYLPNHYKDWIINPDRVNLVLETGEKEIIGFVSACFQESE